MPDIVYDTGYPGRERREVRHPGRQHRRRAGLHRSEADRHPGPLVGRLPDHAPDHADQHVRRGAGRRVGVEHDQRLRRHPLGHRHVARVPVREDAEPHRRAAVGRAAAVHRELADLLGREGQDAVPHRSTTTKTTRCRGIRASSSSSAMRRLGKEAYMFVYNGEPHGLRNRDNMKHWTVHQDEFFDHFLLGKPKPEWMEKGVPYLEKGRRDVTDMFKPKVDDDRRRLGAGQVVRVPDGQNPPSRSVASSCRRYAHGRLGRVRSGRVGGHDHRAGRSPARADRARHRSAGGHVPRASSRAAARRSSAG